MKKIPVLLFILFFLAARPATLLANEIPGEPVAQGIELIILPVPQAIAQADDVAQTPRETDDALLAASEKNVAAPQKASEENMPEEDSVSMKTENSLPVELVILRVEPDQVTFELHLASNTGKALPLEQWAKTRDLAIATNAGMFLPDGITNTGYMRYNEHINNGRIVKNFGAFFVASPKPEAKAGLKNAAILDRQADAWEESLSDYGLVIQNYRLINEKGKPIWLPDGKPFSTSALAQDNKGRILFIFCAYPLNGYNFARAVLALPLNVTRLMYLEGGAPATLVLNTPSKSRVWNNSGMLGGFFPPSPIPNVLGVKIKHTESK